MVSGLIQGSANAETALPFRDGFLTKRNTFQKFYDQGELQQYIEDALETPAVPVALGVFYVFRDPADLQDFLAGRTRRIIDWTQIHPRLGLGRPEPRTQRLRKHLYEENKDLLDAYWMRALELGRWPLESEFDRYEDLREKIRYPKKAARLLLERFGTEPFEQAQDYRKKDLLVYLAMANFQKRPSFRRLSESLRTDIKTFFHDFKKALGKGRELLFAAGDPDEIELACEETMLGWQDEQALHVHRPLLEQLPPLLRVYVGCASMLYGDVNQADTIKIHKRSGKVTFLIHENFDTDLSPPLHWRIKVNLRTRWVQVFDHSVT